MKSPFYQRLPLWLLGILLVLSLNACKDSGTGWQERVWQEEIPLSNGHTIWVDRSKRQLVRASGPFGQGGMYDNIVSTVGVSSSEAQKAALPPPFWQGQGDVTILFDYDEEKQTRILLTSFIMCDVWVKWGRPALPYRQYEVQGNEWVLVSVDEKLIGRPANIYGGTVKPEIKRVTIEDRKKLLWRAIPDYKKIVGYDWKNNCRGF